MTDTSPQAALAKSDPLMQAWDDYKASEDFRTAVHWSLRIMPFIQSGDPEGESKARDLMPLQQRTDHVHGALWNAFVAGYRAAQGGTDE